MSKYLRYLSMTFSLMSTSDCREVNDGLCRMEVLFKLRKGASVQFYVGFSTFKVAGTMSKRLSPPPSNFNRKSRRWDDGDDGMHRPPRTPTEKMSWAIIAAPIAAPIECI